MEKGRRGLSMLSHLLAAFPVAVIKYPTKAIYRRTGLSGYSPSWPSWSPRTPNQEAQRDKYQCSAHEVQNSSTGRGASYLN